ncbi:MAG: iron-containing alcohol dehydrogenase [Firmicutes bacterium]|nr:iron-containing alcohol dehydrogenase [Bacillota bacterium]
MNGRFFLPTRIHFGPGTLRELSHEVGAGQRVMVVTDPGLLKLGLVEKVASIIKEAGGRAVVFSDVEANPHASTVTAARAILQQEKADLVIGLGGGSPMDVAKALSFLATNDGPLEDYQWQGRQIVNPPLPFIAVATTAGTGSEVTRTAVIVDRDTKQGIISDALFPRVAIVDPELQLGLPPLLTATTGMDALTHAAEAYIGLRRSPFTDAWSLEAIKLVSRFLLRAFANGRDLPAREGMAVASTLAGAAMDQGGLGVVHALAGPLSSHYDVPHGLANAVLLADGLVFNEPVARERLAHLAVVLGVVSPGATPRQAAYAFIQWVREMTEDLGLVGTLRRYAIPASHLETIGQEAAAMGLIRNNPRQASGKDCATIYSKVIA